jgi:hypothetical protein
MKKLRQFLIMIIITSLLAACNMPARPTATPIIDQALAGTIVAMTLESLLTPTANIGLPTQGTPYLQLTDMNSPVPSSTPSPIVTITQTGTITPTYSAPLLRFDGNTNCREGPGTSYKVVTVLRAGQKIQPTGIQGNYWIVQNPNGKGTCWVATDYATPSGSVWTLTTMTAPVPPTGEPPTAPKWANWNDTCAAASGGLTVTMNLKWIDLATGETGFKIYRDGELIATLGPDSNSYTDVAFMANGKTMSYYIEVFKDTAQSDSATINAICQ